MAIEPHNAISKSLQELIEKLKKQIGSVNHETLQGLLGGNASGHFHLTQSEIDKLKKYPDFDNLNHERLNGLLGGNTAGHFHLTDEQLNKLNNLPNSITQNHEGLYGLLGGNSAGHYHLTQNELNKLGDYPAFNQLNHEQLQGLLGGNSAGHYHLSQDLLNKLINIPASGVPGENGSAATIQIGTVTTGAAGTNASVTNSGTPTNAIFNFVIPRGDKGDKGSSGTGSSVDIINNLTSTRTDAALSAYQGKVLNDKITKYYTEDWTFTLDDNSTVTKKVVLSS